MVNFTMITNKVPEPDGYQPEIRLIRLGGMIGDAFGNPVVEIHGPFAEDYTNLKWRYCDHRDGETAEYSVCGIYAFVQDCDGDYSVWSIRKGGRRGDCVTHGQEDDFFPALATAEAALRQIIADRIKELRARKATS